MNNFQKYLSTQLQKADRDVDEAQRSVNNYQREIEELTASLKRAQENLSATVYMAKNHRRVYEAEMKHTLVTETE